MPKYIKNKELGIFLEKESAYCSSIGKKTKILKDRCIFNKMKTVDIYSFRYGDRNQDKIMVSNSKTDIYLKWGFITDELNSCSKNPKNMEIKYEVKVDTKESCEKLKDLEKKTKKVVKKSIKKKK